MKPVKQYRVTVAFDVIVDAISHSEAHAQVAEEIPLPSNCVEDSLLVVRVRELNVFGELIGEHNGSVARAIHDPRFHSATHPPKPKR